MYTCILDPNELQSGRMTQLHNIYYFAQSEMFSFLEGGSTSKSLDYLIYSVVDQEMFMQWTVVFYTSSCQFWTL